MKNKLSLFLISLIIVALYSCSKSATTTPTTTTTTTAKINFIFKFDSTQVRLNSHGEPDTMAAGDAGQSPRFNLMSAHYLELSPNEYTALGAGDVLYTAPETTAGGDSAIDFSKSTFAGNNDTFLTVPLSSVKAGSYSWLRVSLAYQNYNVWVNINTPIPIYPYQFSAVIDATVASFIGFDTYISSFKVKDSTVTVDANKLQGFWAIEGSYNYLGTNYGLVDSGQAAPGATTVPNPLFATSPIPQGSCVVTGAFPSALVITGKETSDINVVVSLSTNKSFEWKDFDHNGTYDPVPNPPTNPSGDSVVNMGIRGMIPSIQ
jgi:hypothetical protein